MRGLAGFQLLTAPLCSRQLHPVPSTDPQSKRALLSWALRPPAQVRMRSCCCPGCTLCPPRPFNRGFRAWTGQGGCPQQERQCPRAPRVSSLGLSFTSCAVGAQSPDPASQACRPQAVSAAGISRLRARGQLLGAQAQPAGGGLRVTGRWHCGPPRLSDVPSHGWGLALALKHVLGTARPLSPGRSRRPGWAAAGKAEGWFS